MRGSLKAANWCDKDKGIVVVALMLIESVPLWRAQRTTIQDGDGDEPSNRFHATRPKPLKLPSLVRRPWQPRPEALGRAHAGRPGRRAPGHARRGRASGPRRRG